MAWPWYLTDVRLALLIVALLGPATGFSGPVFTAATAVAAVGVVAAYAFYVHNSRLVFSRHAPSPWKDSRALLAFFKMTRPLETVFRLLTAPLRDTPDIFLLGETRCGTTTLSAYLKELPGAQAPFCPWIHPLEGKETFYFVGHYFGVVHPLLQRAPYPFVFWRWLARLRGRPYFCFDGCAQYLTAPWAPRLIHAAAPKARLMACIREPVQQAVSWWCFENAAMAWAEGMPLGSDWTAERGEGFPPTTLLEAFHHSQSAATQDLYERSAWPSSIGWRLPYALGTWPGGQLGAFGRSGCYLDNIRRYEEWFGEHCITLFELTELAQSPDTVVSRMLDLLPREVSAAVGRKRSWKALHHNANRGAADNSAASEACKRILASYFRDKNEELFAYMGRRFPWHEMSYYGGETAT